MTADKIIKIEDPREAWKVIMTSKDLSPMEMVQMTYECARPRNITTDEMAFHPDGERVLKPKYPED